MKYELFWEKFFRPIILERGYDYYIDGHVSSFKKTDKGYIGTVSGTADYIVTINSDNDGNDLELRIDCDCPYALDGNYCKHMAALLYAIEYSNSKDNDYDNNHEKNEIDKTGPDTPTKIAIEKRLRDVINGLDVKILQDELYKILVSDNDLKTHFLLRYDKNEKTIRDYIYKKKETARSIHNQFSDRHGFVDWRNAGNFTSNLIHNVISELHDFASSDIEEVKAAFDVSLYVYQLFADTDIDDSGGETQYFTDACLELWEDIIESCESDELAGYILDKLNCECERIGIGEYMAKEIDDFISDHFSVEGFAKSRLEVLDERINRFINDNSWTGKFNLTNSIKARIDIMQEIGTPEKEIIEFRKQYWHLPEIRKIEMQEYETAGNLKELIMLLEVSKEIDKEYPGLVKEYSEKLIKCYNDDGWYQKAKEELFTFITVYSPANVNAFIQLRNSTAEEIWVNKREEIFNVLLKKRYDIKPLLAEEKLIDRLFETIQDEVNNGRILTGFIVSTIIKYEQYLRPKYDSELLEIYRKAIMKMAERAGGRGLYRDVVDTMKMMLSYPNGKETAEELMQHFRLYYSNRPAMMDELQALYR